MPEVKWHWVFNISSSLTAVKMSLSYWNHTHTHKVMLLLFVCLFFLTMLLIDRAYYEFFYCSHSLVYLQSRFASFSCDLSIAAASQEVIIVQVELMWQGKSMGSMNRKIGLTYYPGDGGLTPMQWIQNQVALTAKGQISAMSIFCYQLKTFHKQYIQYYWLRGKTKKRFQLFIDLTSLCIEQGRKKDTYNISMLKMKCAERSAETSQAFSELPAYDVLAILEGRSKNQIGHYKNL